jgi:peptidoglycan hydrolase-like protein with peptidoglycan-binding domain
VLYGVFAISAWAAPQTSTSKSTSKKRSVGKESATKTAAKSSTTSSVKHTPKAPSSKRPVAVVHRAPQQPSSARYKEIQQALADKGYFRSEPDGTWGPASVDALKHFQHDQKLAEDGKIGSLSLIALGLGPKREPTAETEQKTP